MMACLLKQAKKQAHSSNNTKKTKLNIQTARICMNKFKKHAHNNKNTKPAP